MPVAAYALADAYDYVVVGRGAAGYVLAACLSADPAVSVLVVEPCSGHAGPRLADTRLAGGASDADHGIWARMLGPAWSWDGMRGHYEELKAEDTLADAVRSRTRPWRAPASGTAWTDALWRAVTEAALTAPQACECLAVAPAPPAAQGGMAMQMLSRLRPGLRNAGRLAVERIRVVQGRATGLELTSGCGRRFVAARQEVILAAGAVDNPCILQRSGIGPEHLLAPWGIDVVRALPAGSQLQAHVWLQASFGMRASDGIAGSLGAACRDVARRAGAFLQGAPRTLAEQAVLRLCTGEDGQRPDIEVQLQASTQPTRDAAGPSCMTVDVRLGLLRPRSRGHVRITGASARHAPDMDLAALQDRLDLRVAEAGLRLVRRILRQPSLAPHRVASESSGFLRDDLGGANDPRWPARLVDAVGTCRMGTDDASVVDPQFQVHGIAGLRVADASVLPCLPSGDVDAPAAAIALEAARHIRSGATLHPPDRPIHPFDVFKTAIPMW
jgi:choline dehydrogenase